MAEGKKSFVLYSDLIKTVSKLPNEKAGELFKHLLEYVNDLDPITDDLLIEVAFEPIKQQLKRDLDKWGTTREGRSKAGKASAEARKQRKEQEATNPTLVESVVQTSTNPTVSVNDNVTVNVNDINKSQQFSKELIEFSEKFYDALEKYGDIKKRPATINKKNMTDLKLLHTSDGFSFDEITELAGFYFHVGRERSEAPFVIQSLTSLRKKANSLQAAIRNHKE